MLASSSTAHPDLPVCLTTVSNVKLAFYNLGWLIQVLFDILSAFKNQGTRKRLLAFGKGNKY